MFLHLVWSAAVNLFSTCILFDQYLWGEYHNVVTNNFNGSSYDFIIGENSQNYHPQYAGLLIGDDIGSGSVCYCFSLNLRSAAHFVF